MTEPAPTALTPAQRTQAMLLLAEPRLAGSPFRLALAQRAYDAGWTGTLSELASAAAGIEHVRDHGDAVKDHADALRRHPHYGYVLAVERALAGRGLPVVARRVETSGVMLGQLTLDLAAAVRAFPRARSFGIGWNCSNGWWYTADVPDRSPPEVWRSGHVYWLQDLVPEPAAVAGWVARTLDGDRSPPPRRAWHLDGEALMAALGVHSSLELADPSVPTRAGQVREGSLEQILKRSFRSEPPPPPPRVGEDIYVPSRLFIGHPEDDFHGGLARVTAVHEIPPGGLDTCCVTIAEDADGGGYSWDRLAPEQEQYRQRYGHRRARPKEGR
ncbi:hypothetical protein GCM10010399_62740 [Dactylosporangium fulvum]|uniref:DUF6292 family protein n=1 Tax=Dactylosporangium fulvum TaxID=53359 RepID=A0ABY5WC03_9ACTN|nr:DUF6292 family protein [Dactylosporangium fulvum]UWP87057.1 DUF6292 family protein [Dactylosporangium fulvum]